MISNIQIKDIKGYEGLYAITSCGKIYSYTSKKFLKPIQQKNGYLRICLSKNNIRKNFLIHRLVIETYNPVDNMENLQVNHINENKVNNFLNNLQWVTPKDNINYGNRNTKAGKKISKANKNHKALSKPIICIETKIIYPSIHEAARQLNFDSSYLAKSVKMGKKVYGFTWEYIEIKESSIYDF